MQNRQAFLEMIANSEGTAYQGDNGYNVLVGSTPKAPHLFKSYSDHPRQHIQYAPGKWSTAAGRYQEKESNYDAYKHFLGLPDFSPDSQDKMAIQQIRECGALPDIDAGQIRNAIDRCAHIWASFPGAGYGQREQKIEHLLDVYKRAGGTISA